MIKEEKRRKKLLHRILAAVNAMAAFAMGMALMAPYLDPVHFILPAFAGLAFPFLVLTNIILLILWLIVRPPLAWLNAIVLLPAFLHTGTFIQWNGSTPDCDSSIKVMSYNVRLFDLYNWTHNKVTRNKIIGLLNKEHPDILCLQEFFYSPERGYFNTLDTLSEVLGSGSHTYYSTSRKNKYYFGIATFSHYPILSKGLVDFGKKTHNACIYTDLLVDSDTIRVYNAHLASVKLNDSEYRYINTLTSPDQDSAQEQVGTAILIQLGKAFRQRSGQVGAILRHMQLCPYPIVFCTDLNDTPSSYAYHRISEKLDDAFVEKGMGLGKTYNGSLPVTRIDYIFHSAGWAPCSFNTLPEDYSDHFPITAGIKRRQSNP